jgi:hypothetical protein
MFDAFPYDTWDELQNRVLIEEGSGDFWTFGGAESTGTWILTVLGVAVMLIALIGFVWLEKRKLDRQAALLRASGALDRPTAPTIGPAV